MRARFPAAARAAALAALAALVTLGGCSTVDPALTHAAMGVERWHAGLARKAVDLPDGTHIAYLEGGQGDPLVLVHGFGTDKDNFTRVARYLTPHYHVVVPDLVGFGQSTHLAGADYRYAAQAARVHAFVQALGLSRVDLGGNSMGGGIVMSYAAQYPREVRSLWLLDPAGVADAPPSEMVKTLLAGGRNPLIITSTHDLETLMTYAMVDPPYVPGPVLETLARERIANQALEREVFDQIAHDSVSAAVRGLATPTLIVWGAQDRVLSPETVPMLQALLPHSQAIVMPGVGHAPMLEKPRQSADDYLRFRAGLAANDAR